MFKVGDYVVYGSKGVCQVTDITDLTMPGADEPRSYYLLTPMEDQGATVYLPVDNKKAVIRSVMTEEEAKALLDQIPEIEELDVPDDKKREQHYKDAMKTCDSRVWVSFMKTLYIRKEQRIRLGKKVTALDEKFLRAVEHELFDEISIVLHIDPDEMREYMIKSIKA